MALEIDGGAIVYQNRSGVPYYLLLKSATSDFWGFPKGHVEGSESLMEAAEREIKEETGLIVKVDDDFYDIINYPVGDNNKRLTLFTAQVSNEAVVRLQTEEISASGWFDYVTAREKLTYLNLKQVLDKVDHYLKEHL